RELALQVTYGTSRMGPRPLSQGQKSLAQNMLSELRARRVTTSQPGDGVRSHLAAASRQCPPGAAGRSPDRGSDRRLARARARRWWLRENDKRFEAWAQDHQDVIHLLRGFTDDPRIPFLRHLAIQVTDGWEGRKMPLTPNQIGAVKRILQALPDLTVAP